MHFTGNERPRGNSTASDAEAYSDQVPVLTKDTAVRAVKIVRERVAFSDTALEFDLARRDIRKLDDGVRSVVYWWPWESHFQASGEEI